MLQQHFLNLDINYSDVDIVKYKNKPHELKPLFRGQISININNCVVFLKKVILHVILNNINKIVCVAHRYLSTRDTEIKGDSLTFILGKIWRIISSKYESNMKKSLKSIFIKIIIIE